ncbi:MAG: hypothetical protein HUU56_08490 [Bdellovibrionaceae bacterium]|nr:hypothetical protein [Pseudobdellovibrionaceae bacterium]
MKKILLIAFVLNFTLGCLDENETKTQVAYELTGLAEKKTIAEDLINKKDFSLEALLSMQEYFFDITEKIYLLKMTPEAEKNLLALVQKEGFKSFCSSYILPTAHWQNLNRICTTGNYYLCSPEMQNYLSTMSVLNTMLGSDLLTRECGINFQQP